jgi:repressor LexA
MLPRAWAHLRASSSSLDPELIRVPVVGRIAAGVPIEAVEGVEEELPLPSQLACPGDFLLRVQGESLIEDGILDGDLVLIRPHARVQNGDIAVALLPDGSATLKHVHFEKDAVVLRPANPMVPPLRVGQVTLQGRMAGLWRRY